MLPRGAGRKLAQLHKLRWEITVTEEGQKKPYHSIPGALRWLEKKKGQVAGGPQRKEELPNLVREMVCLSRVLHLPRSE